MVVFVVAAAYAVGGRALFRRVLAARTRAVAAVQASLQPPAQSAPDIRGTIADTATAPPVAGRRPVSIAFIALTLTGVFGIAVAAFYVTGRRR